MFTYLRLFFRAATGGFGSTYSPAWDATLRQLMQHGKCTAADKYSVTFVLGGKEFSVWRANGFYSMGQPFLIRNKTVADECTYRPGIKTIAKFYRDFVIPADRELCRLHAEKVNELLSVKGTGNDLHPRIDN